MVYGVQHLELALFQQWLVVYSIWDFTASPMVCGAQHMGFNVAPMVCGVQHLRCHCFTNGLAW